MPSRERQSFSEIRGIASGHIGQGTFVRRAPIHSDTNTSAEIVNLALNVPATGSEASVLSATFSEIARQRYLATLLDYHPHGGIMKHREVIAKFISHAGLYVEAERVFAEARRDAHRVWADNSPYELKDALKKRGYRWSDGNDGSTRAWYIEVAEDALDREIAILRREITSATCRSAPARSRHGRGFRVDYEFRWAAYRGARSTSRGPPLDGLNH